MSKEENQKALDIVLNGLMAQGWKQSIDESGSCVYRGEKGTKCAIGFLIPDEVYDPRMEHDDLPSVLKYPGVDTKAEGDLLDKLQVFHDRYLHSEILANTAARELQKIADEFDLKVSGDVYNSLLRIPPC